jgi:hypothetical protein
MFNHICSAFAEPHAMFQTRKGLSHAPLKRVRAHGCLLSVAGCNKDEVAGARP